MRLRIRLPTLPTLVIVGGAALLLLAVYGVVPTGLGIPGLVLLFVGGGLSLRRARREGLDLPGGPGGP